MDQRVIFGLQITDRVKNVKTVQAILTEYGCYIKTRLGLHDVDADYCSPHGLVLLETFGDEAKIAEMEMRLKAVEGLQFQKMVFQL